MGPGTYASNFGDETLREAPAPSDVQPQRVPWYNNPGFWSKVGATGAALLPKWSPLKSAGEYAASYHNAQQLDAAQRKVLANAAAGVDPMTDMTDADTMGLSAEQIANLTKTGMARQSELAKEGREAALAENTLATGISSRDYMKSLTDKANEELRQNAMFEQHIKDVSEGNVESKYITKENAEFFKAIGPKRSNEIISEIVKQEEIAKRQGKKTEQVHLGDRIKLVESATGLPIQEWKVGPKPADEGTSKKNTAGLISAANKQAFVDLYPEIEKEFYASFKGNKAEAAKKMQELKLMFDNPNTSEGAMLKMRTMAPNTHNAFTVRSNEVLNSYESGKGTPPMSNLIGTPDQPRTSQNSKELEKIMKHPNFESGMAKAAKGVKVAGIYDVPVNGISIKVRFDGKGNWSIAAPTSGGKK